MSIHEAHAALHDMVFTHIPRSRARPRAPPTCTRRKVRAARPPHPSRCLRCRWHVARGAQSSARSTPSPRFRRSTRRATRGAIARAHSPCEANLKLKSGILSDQPVTSVARLPRGTHPSIRILSTTTTTTTTTTTDWLVG